MQKLIQRFQQLFTTRQKRIAHSSLHASHFLFIGLDLVDLCQVVWERNIYQSSCAYLTTKKNDDEERQMLITSLIYYYRRSFALLMLILRFTRSTRSSSLKIWTIRIFHLIAILHLNILLIRYHIFPLNFTIIHRCFKFIVILFRAFSR